MPEMGRLPKFQRFQRFQRLGLCPSGYSGHVVSLQSAQNLQRGPCFFAFLSGLIGRYALVLIIVLIMSEMTCAPAPRYRAKRRGKPRTTKSVTTSEAYQIGKATYYGKKFHGRKTANGETFNMYALTAAHRKLPFGTKVRVTNLANGMSVVVRINDRGPFVKGRIIDLSYAAAKKIGLVQSGVAKVKLEIVK